LKEEIAADRFAACELVVNYMIMKAYRASLGKVFISYSSLDRVITRKIDARLKKEGFSIWLDEHQLLVGDPLAKEISTAISRAKAVLVVVSANSIKSRWLKYELNIATERMIKGECRVIPVVIDDVQLLPEVQGLMYADLRKSFKYGIRGIISALDHEAHKSALDQSFYRKADMIVDEIFGSREHVSAGSEYESWNYESVSVPVESDEAEETFIAYETVSDYSGKSEPLSKGWWDEYQQSRDKYSEHLHLVITERPVTFNIPQGPDSSVFVYRSINIPSQLLIGAIVFVDMSKVKSMSERIESVKAAREVLVTLAEELRAYYNN
jgi:hypothetical protein